MKAIYKKRLLKLADLLMKDAKNKKGIMFNLSLVTKSNPKQNGDGYEPIAVSCGTQACAMGLAAISGAFANQGVGWEQRGNDIQMWMKKRRGRVYGWGTVAERLFGLHTYEVDWLFTTDSYEDEGLPTTEAEGERAVAKRLKDFANGKVFAPIPDDLANKGRWAPPHA